MRARLMEFARLAAELDPKLAAMIEDWDRMKPALQKSVDLDLLCELHGIDPARFIAIGGEAGRRFRDDASVLIAAINMPAVVAASVKRALTPEGIRDRRMLLEHAGLLPVPKGRVLNFAAIRAQAKGEQIRKPLPSFESTIAQIEEIDDDTP